MGQYAQWAIRAACCVTSSLLIGVTSTLKGVADALDDLYAVATGEWEDEPDEDDPDDPSREAIPAEPNGDELAPIVHLHRHAGIAL